MPGHCSAFCDGYSENERTNYWETIDGTKRLCTKAVRSRRRLIRSVAEKCFTLYKGDLSDIANICIAAFVTMESFNLYVKPDNMHSTLHTFQITKQNVAALETLRNRYDISISHLFNAAIAYVLKSHNT